MLKIITAKILKIVLLVSGINPEDFDIYGMDGTLESEDEKTPLNNMNETPR